MREYQSPGRMKNSSYYIAPVGVRTHDLPHTVASNMGKVSHALTHSATAAFITLAPRAGGECEDSAFGSICLSACATKKLLLRSACFFNMIRVARFSSKMNWTLNHSKIGPNMTSMYAMTSNVRYDEKMRNHVKSVSYRARVCNRGVSF